MTGLRIMQVLPDFDSGGVERATHEIAAYLKKSGIDNIVCSSGGALVSELKKDGIRHITSTMNSKNIFVMLKNIYSIARLIKTNEIDIVHARSRAPAWSCYFACMVMRCKFVTTFHAAYSATHPLKRFYNSIMLKGDKVIAISNYIRKHIETRYRFTSNKLEVIDEGVDLNYFNPKKINADRLQLLNEVLDLNLKGEKLIILPARFTRLKGHLYLLKALKYVNYSHYKCLIIGKASDDKASYLKEIDQAIKAAKLTDKVIVIKQPFNDMPALYSIADIMISASTEPEGFGKTIIEAQAMNCMVISTNIGAPFDLIEDGKSGFLVPTSDAATFAESIDHALNLAPAQRKKIVDYAAKIVKLKYSLEVMCQKTLAIYQNLFDGSDGK